MKTSKIKTVQSVKEYAGQKGTIFYHNLEMENGDKINIGKQKPQTVGTELTYELTGGDDDQQQYKKAKSVQPMQQGAKYESKDTGVITMLSCISSACNAVAQSSDYKNYHVISDLAVKFFDLAMSKSNK